MICGKCKAPAETVATVKACHAGERWPCGWLVSLGYDEDGELRTRECGAHVRESDAMGSWECEAGHEYTSMEARWKAGTEYAESDEEAAQLIAAGVQPILVDPGPALFVGHSGPALSVQR